jgi:hypothetical protein
MRRLLDFFIRLLLIVILASACRPAIPGPAQPTQTVEAADTPTTAQVAQVIQTPTLALPPECASGNGTSTTGCNPPAGWSPYTVKPGDTLVALAKQVNLTPEELMRSNCLASSLISAERNIVSSPGIMHAHPANGLAPIHRAKWGHAV